MPLTAMQVVHVYLDSSQSMYMTNSLGACAKPLHHDQVLLLCAQQLAGSYQADRPIYILLAAE